MTDTEAYYGEQIVSFENTSQEFDYKYFIDILMTVLALISYLEMISVWQR